MLGVNKVILIGWVGNDPELRYTPAQKPVVSLSLATHRQIYDAQGERQQLTDWHKLIFQDALAEYCAHKIIKGSKVFVEGIIEYRQRTHHEFKGAKWMEALVVVKLLRIIDGSQSADAYPDDFPPLPHVQLKAADKKSSGTSSQGLKQEKPDLFNEP